MGILVTYFDVDLVLKAFVITTAVFIGLTLYTMQSKYDFSTWGARYVDTVEYLSKECNGYNTTCTFFIPEPVNDAVIRGTVHCVISNLLILFSACLPFFLC